MLILPRYILREHLKPFLFGVSIITLVFLLNLIFRELGKFLSRGLGFRVMAEFFFLNLAWIIALSVPMAVLLAALMAFGRLSGDGEIIGMKAGGISILRIISPVIVASIFLAVFLIWFNNHVLPDANYRTKLLAYDISRKRPTLSLEPGVVYRDIENYTILVEGLKETPDTSFVTNIYIEDNSRNISGVYIWGKRGKIFLNRQNGMLYIFLYDGEMHELNLETMEQYRRVQFPQQLLSIAVPEMVLTRSQQGYRGDREKSAQMMLDEVKENKVLIRDRMERLASLIRDHVARIAGKAPLPLDKQSPQIVLQNERLRLLQQVKSELRSIESLERENSRLMVEVHKKYSIPFACLVFVLVGAPLGIMARKGSMAIAGSIAFIFFLIYWASLIGGEELADNRYISPFLAMWFANIICGAGGIYLIIYSIHETTFINFDAMGRALMKPFRRGKFGKEPC